MPSRPPEEGNNVAELAAVFVSFGTGSLLKESHQDLPRYTSQGIKGGEGWQIEPSLREELHEQKRICKMERVYKDRERTLCVM